MLGDSWADALWASEVSWTGRGSYVWRLGGSSPGTITELLFLRSTSTEEFISVMMTLREKGTLTPGLHLVITDNSVGQAPIEATGHPWPSGESRSDSPEHDQLPLKVLKWGWVP
jgi:hypothetical protein